MSEYLEHIVVVGEGTFEMSEANLEVKEIPKVKKIPEVRDIPEVKDIHMTPPPPNTSLNLYVPTCIFIHFYGTVPGNP